MRGGVLCGLGYPYQLRAKRTAWAAGWGHGLVDTCLPRSHEGLSSDPQRPGKTLGVEACLFNTDAGEAETGGSLELTSLSA